MMRITMVVAGLASAAAWSDFENYSTLPSEEEQLEAWCDFENLPPKLNARVETDQILMNLEMEGHSTFNNVYSDNLGGLSNEKIESVFKVPGMMSSIKAVAAVMNVLIPKTVHINTFSDDIDENARQDIGKKRCEVVKHMLVQGGYTNHIQCESTKMGRPRASFQMGTLQHTMQAFADSIKKLQAAFNQVKFNPKENSFSFMFRMIKTHPKVGEKYSSKWCKYDGITVFRDCDETLAELDKLRKVMKSIGNPEITVNALVGTDLTWSELEELGKRRINYVQSILKNNGMVATAGSITHKQHYLGVKLVLPKTVRFEESDQCKAGFGLTED